MPVGAITDIVIMEDSTAICLARVNGLANAPIVRADVSTISVSVTDIDNSTTVIDALSITVSDAVYDTLQTTSDDARWTKDTTGFNFLYQLPHTAFPTGDVDYAIEYLFTMSDVNSSQFILPFGVRTRQVYRS